MEGRDWVPPVCEPSRVVLLPVYPGSMGAAFEVRSAACAQVFWTLSPLSTLGYREFFLLQLKGGRASGCFYWARGMCDFRFKGNAEGERL